jgi:Na+-driven multidrug efflux pump
MGLQMIFSSVYQAAGNTTVSMLLTIFSQWIVQLPLAYFLSRHTGLGLNGIWLSFPISNLIVSLVSWLVFKNGYWKKKRLINNEGDKIELLVSQKIMAEENVPYDY